MGLRTNYLKSCHPRKVQFLCHRSLVVGRGDRTREANSRVNPNRCSRDNEFEPDLQSVLCFLLSYLFASRCTVLPTIVRVFFLSLPGFFNF